MNKLFVSIMVLLLGLSIVACSSNDSEEVERLKQEIEALKAAPTATATATPAPKPTSTPRPTPTPILGPSLELLSYRCYKEYDYAMVEGQVKNITNKKMDNVEATVDWYSSDGTFITSDEYLIKYNPLLPNQTSSFITYSTLNPAMSKCGVGFKYLMGGSIDFKSPTATATPTPRPTSTPRPPRPTPSPTPTPIPYTEDEALARILAKPELAAMVLDFGGIGEIYSFEYIPQSRTWLLIADFPLEKLNKMTSYGKRSYQLSRVRDKVQQVGDTICCKTY